MATLSVGPDYSPVTCTRIECSDARTGDLLSPLGSLAVYEVLSVWNFTAWQRFNVKVVGSEDPTRIGRELSITSSSLIRAFRPVTG